MLTIEILATIRLSTQMTATDAPGLRTNPVQLIDRFGDSPDLRLVFEVGPRWDLSAKISAHSTKSKPYFLSNAFSPTLCCSR